VKTARDIAFPAGVRGRPAHQLSPGPQNPLVRFAVNTSQPHNRVSPAERAQPPRRRRGKFSSFRLVCGTRAMSPAGSEGSPTSRQSVFLSAAACFRSGKFRPGPGCRRTQRGDAVKQPVLGGGLQKSDQQSLVNPDGGCGGVEADPAQRLRQSCRRSRPLRACWRPEPALGRCKRLIFEVDTLVGRCRTPWFPPVHHHRYGALSQPTPHPQEHHLLDSGPPSNRGRSCRRTRV